MQQIEKSQKLNNVHYEVRGLGPAEADRMAAAGEKILHLNIGNPAMFGFSAPEALFEALVSNVRNSQAYSDSHGILSARQAIADYHISKGLPNVSIEDIFTGNGASELVTMCMQALLNSGDEILIPTPDYPLYTASATLAGGKAVHYICDEAADWHPDIDDIKRKVSPRTKAIVVINPNNPTGALYDRACLEEIVKVARAHNLVIFADEIYDRSIFNGYEHTSIAALAPDLFCVTINGLSKSHVVCGYRCGWMCLSGAKEQAHDYIEGLTVLASMRLCSNVLSQQVVEVSLKHDARPNPWLMPGGRLYEQAKLVTRELNDIPGVSVVEPKASLYCFPKLDVKRFNITDDTQFALDFLHHSKVLVVQGSGFNWPTPDHFRIVYLPDLPELQAAMDSLRAFLADYRQA